MRVLGSRRTWHSSHTGTPRATLRCCVAAASCGLQLGIGGACIDPGPLFSADQGIDAGVEVGPGLGGAGPSGMAGGPGAAPVTPPPGVEPARDAGLTPTEGPPLPGGPIEVPPGCDGGSSTGCVDPPDEPPPDEPLPPDACDDCLAEVCPADLQRCDETEGCGAIVDCARRTRCELDACYCGTFSELLCTTTGQANGPCRDVMLAAPGAHPPNFIDPSAGPAAVAARSVGACRLANDACREACGS